MVDKARDGGINTIQITKWLVANWNMGRVNDTKLRVMEYTIENKLYLKP